MTKEKFEANERKQQRIIDANNCCEICGEYTHDPQLAHIIRKDKPNLKLFGKEIIHHDLNLVLKEDFSVPAGVLDTVCKQRIAHNNYVKHNGVYPAGNESDRTKDQCVNCIDTTDNICFRKE